MLRPRILIGDDHRLVAEGIAKLLQDDYEIAEIVEDGGRGGERELICFFIL